MTKRVIENCADRPNVVTKDTCGCYSATLQRYLISVFDLMTRIKRACNN